MKYVLMAGAALLLGYEIYTAIGPGKTISEIIWAASDKSKAIPFFFGLLMGHLFMPRKVSTGVITAATPHGFTVGDKVEVKGESND